MNLKRENLGPSDLFPQLEYPNEFTDIVFVVQFPKI